ncbi:MAG: hypothetical protein IJY11_03725 [Clostridia bacterium]|nr:hypothetical protein [Clostridia bacterium]
MEKKNAAEILAYLEKLLTEYLEDLKDSAATDKNLFAYGEKTAYVECLEIIQRWDESSLGSADDAIEERFPL